MIDFWNGIHTPDGAVWFNRFTNEYEFEKRPDGFDAYLLGKRAYNMMSKFDINDIVTVPYDHDKKYWTVTAVRTSQIEMRAIYDLVSAKTGIALYDVPEVDMTLVNRPTQKKENSVMDKRYMVKKLIYHGLMIVCGNIINLQKITDAELRAATAVKLDRILSKLVEKENGNEGGCKMGSDCLHYGIGCRSCGNSSSYGEVCHESGENAGWTPGK